MKPKPLEYTGEDADTGELMTTKSNVLSAVEWQKLEDSKAFSKANNELKKLTTDKRIWLTWLGLYGDLKRNRDEAFGGKE